MGQTFIADKATLDKVYNIVAADGVYGFIEHMDILSPSQRVEYIGMNAGYTPMTVTKGGGYSLNSWAEFPWLLGNKPYMVKSDGKPFKRLKEDDYTQYEDGTASDVANTEFDGGAFAWAPKIYKFEKMVGNDRIVKFSLEARDGFEPIGFKDSDNKELEGVWIPMFYGSTITGKCRSLAGLQPDASKTTAQQKEVIDAVGARAKFFGGAIVETLIDLMIMFAKTTNLQEAYGNGNCSGYVNDPDKYYGVLQNAVVGGGQFYGTNDSKSLNKIFHSIVLGTHQQYMRDPYTLLVNGEVKVSKNYAYDVTGATYDATGISYDSTSTGWEYPNRFQTIPGYGALGVRPCKGSTSSGGCDGLYVDISGVRVGLRFAAADAGLICGPRTLYLGNVAVGAVWCAGSAVLLLPPVGVAA